MPAVTPADVHTSPSRTKIGSVSTVTAGYCSASAAQLDQWVTARRPSSRPASASRNAPLHTEATRRERPAAAAIQSIRPRSAHAARFPGPPTTTSVSIGPWQPAVVPVVAIVMPPLDGIGPVADATISTA
jgi:hypothetical protein